MIKTPKRKYLKTIYAIHEAFGSKFGGFQRTIECGLIPDQELRIRLDQWFNQFSLAKKWVYQQIFDDFKKNLALYLDESRKFDYDTFFKGRGLLNLLQQRWPLFTSQPLYEGLRMEVTGTMRSFCSNFIRTLASLKEKSLLLSKIMDDNQEILLSRKLPEPSRKLLDKYLKDFSSLDIGSFSNYKTLLEIGKKIEAANEEIVIYNYDLNQVIQNWFHPQLRFLEKLERITGFPYTDDQDEDAHGGLEELKKLAGDIPNSGTVDSFLEARSKFISKKKYSRTAKKRRFEDRITFWIKSNEISDPEVKLVAAIEKKISSLQSHLSKREKKHDFRTFREYVRLLRLRAFLAHPNKEDYIQILSSKAQTYLLRGKQETESVIIPGFSWAIDLRGKPSKNAALAFMGKKLYLCLSNSAEDFILDNKGPLRFVKTVGGSRKKAYAKRKTIIYVNGDFLIKQAGGRIPLFLPLHFGKSYVRRTFFNKNWGLFSQSPEIFLSNARLKRKRNSPDEPWRYFVDITISGERVFGFKEFSNHIHSVAQAVIGIDRGENKPIAYAIRSLVNGQVLETGFLAEKYTEQLLKYVNKRVEMQRQGKLIPSSLKSKIARLQETILNTAMSEILSFVGKTKGIVVIEDLRRGFRGIERRIIPKKIYKKVEDLLANALQQAGLLRIGKNGGQKSYWGALFTVSATGTSQQCPQCGILWNGDLKHLLCEFLLSNQPILFETLDTAILNLKNFRQWAEGWLDHQPLWLGRKLTMQKRNDLKNICVNTNTEKINLRQSFQISSDEEKSERTHLLTEVDDLIKKDKDLAVRFLKIAIGPRFGQKNFVCPNCGFEENADIIGAINVAQRGMDSLKKLDKSKLKE